MAESGHFGPWSLAGKYHEVLEPLLRRAFKSFCDFKKAHKLTASQPRFTPARCNRTLRASWACLSSKAIASKVITFWLTAELEAFAGRANASELDKQVALCFWTYAKFLQIMDNNPLILDDAVAEDFFQTGMHHLRLYGALRRRSSQTFGPTALLRHMFLLLPKHHHLEHLLFDVRQAKVNPRFFTLLCAESWIGLVGRCAKACHRASLSDRVLQRYLIKLGLHLEKLPSH